MPKLKYSTLQVFCGKWRKISKSCLDFDLDRTLPNVELVEQVLVDSAIIFLSYQTDR